MVLFQRKRQCGRRPAAFLVDRASSAMATGFTRSQERLQASAFMVIAIEQSPTRIQYQSYV
jgi:hypothetical protein